MNSIGDAMLRTFIGFSVLLVLTRLIGKKQLGQLNIFTYITGIAIGSMAGEIILYQEIDLIIGILVLVLWTVFVYIVETISLKSIFARILLDGEPTIVIKKGQINQKALKKQRLNIDDLTMLLRTNQVFSIAEVAYAVLEPNGDLSVLKMPEKEAVTKGDMQLPSQAPIHLPTAVIMDGKIIKGNLKELGLSQSWLHQQLSLQNIHQHQEVLYAEVQPDNSLYIQQK